MKMLKSILSILAVALLFTSCDKFLDKSPDDRTDLNSKQKIVDLLVSAYGTRDNCFVHKYMSDDVMYMGASYSCNANEESLWRFEDVETEGNDDPRSLWNNYYFAVATANTALEAIEKLGDSDGDLSGPKSEALLCRAYAMWRLADVFCMAYDTDPEKNYPGLPYPKSVGSEIFDRGTLGELYDNINKDIEDALAIFDDAHVNSSKYRFTRKAAYAFAARFNLMYHNWDKAIEYSSKVLADNPFAVLREWKKYQPLGATDCGNLFAQSSEPANLFMHTAYSLAGRRAYGSIRYGHSTTIANYETYWAPCPWGSGSGTGNALWLKKAWGSSNSCSYYRVKEFFEYTDKVGRTGYAHIVMSEFTGEEVLLTRAEAYIMKNEYQKAVDDMNTWMQAECDQSNSKFVVFTVDNVPEWMDKYAISKVNPGSVNRDRTIKKQLNPQGFTITEQQTPYLQLILHMRRIADLFTYRRMTDVKRYGIEYAHPTPDNPKPEDTDKEIFRAGDLRGAVQIPNDVLNAGIAPNPR